MKAYVIKRDDGKYLAGTVELTNKLCKAFIWEKEQDAIDVAIEEYGCQVIPVTIIEGDLEEHDKQVRNELIDKIKYQVERQEDFIDLEFCYEQGIKGTLDLIKSEKVFNILDQLRGGNGE